MEKVDGIGGIFFRAKDPESLAQWYKTHLGVDRIEDVWRPAGGPTVFAPFEENTDYFGNPNQQWMINFRVKDLNAMISQLEAADIEVTTKPEWDSEIGKFARIFDPEGNPIELWQPAT